MEDLLKLQLTTGVSLPVLKKRLLLDILGSAWTAVKVMLILVTFYYVVICAKEYHSSLPIPVKMADTITVSQEFSHLTKSLEYLKCPQSKMSSISEATFKGAKTIGVNPNLILSLIFTESRFVRTAVSPKGYKGYMQTPRASFEYADVDILYGCRILEEKMRSPLAKRNGKVDMRIALALYKGGLSKMAFNQADEVLKLYKTLNSL